MSIKSIFKGLFFSVAAMGISGGAVLAAEGDIDREDRIVYITGDEWRDDCRIWVDGNEIEIELKVYDADGDRDDRDTRDYDIDDIDLIIFQGFDGNDYFRNDSPVPCRVFGDEGHDILIGGESDDDLYGGPGDDFLLGRDGEDDLFGDGGQDYLYGGNHNDYLKAGIGEDEWVIAGQGGEDRFAVPANFNWFTRTMVPIDRYVYADDFNPQQDTEFLFWAPMVYTPVTSTVYPITP